MERILITGRIGAGKSEVARVFREAGFPVYDSDSRTKALYDLIPSLKTQVELAIGEPFSRVGIIFENEGKRLALESVVYPYVLRDFEKWCEERKNSPRVFFESATALSKPAFASLFDKVLLVEASTQERHARNHEAAFRDASQQGVDPSRANWIIRNSGSIVELEKQVKEIFGI